METLGVEPEWKQENECLLSGQQSITSDESALKVSLTAQGDDFDTPENPECLSIEKTLSVQNMTSEYDDVTAGLANTMEDIHQKLESGDDEFLKSVKEFCKQCKKISGMNAKKLISYCKPSLISAFHNFGKGRGHKLKCTKRVIRVQPTSVSRRIIKRCGAKPIKAGRPSFHQIASANVTHGVRNICRNIMPRRNIRSKRLHRLQTSIDQSKQNAR